MKNWAWNWYWYKQDCSICEYTKKYSYKKIWMWMVSGWHLIALD